MIEFPLCHCPSIQAGFVDRCLAELLFAGQRVHWIGADEVVLSVSTESIGIERPLAVRPLVRSQAAQSRRNDRCYPCHRLACAKALPAKPMMTIEVNARSLRMLELLHVGTHEEIARGGLCSSRAPIYFAQSQRAAQLAPRRKIVRISGTENSLAWWPRAE
jgi:hypothetical protein